MTKPDDGGKPHKKQFDPGLPLHCYTNHHVGRLNQLFQPPVITSRRLRFAYAIAFTTDLLQLGLGPFGWAFVDEVLDIAAMILIWRLIGFHPLLLPTFVLEFLPITDMVPTWTGCVAIVGALRKRQHSSTSPLPEGGRVIDI